MSISPDEKRRILDTRNRLARVLMETDATIVIGGVSAFLIAIMQNIPDHKKDEVRSVFQNAIDP
jgi:hypothetical protein